MERNNKIVLERNENQALVMWPKGDSHEYVVALWPNYDENGQVIDWASGRYFMDLGDAYDYYADKPNFDEIREEMHELYHDLIGANEDFFCSNCLDTIDRLKDVFGFENEEDFE